MMFLAHTAAVLPGSFAIGSVRIPVYGLFATAGLISALALSQRTAKRAGLNPDRLWDAGMFAVVAAFVASRALLILTHLQAAMTFPMLMLTMPSLTYSGMLLTVLLTFAFLRWQKIPLLPTLDAWAPCAALLAAVLQIGHYFEGTDAGMPTTLPWGILTPGDSVLGRVHPVQLYAAFLALALTEFLLIRLKYRKRAGDVAAWALTLGGSAVFLLDFVRQPVDSQSPLWLEPSQFVAVAAIIAGAALLLRPSTTTLDQREPPPQEPAAFAGKSSPLSASGATPYQRGATPHETASLNPEGLKARPISATQSQEQIHAQ